MFEESQVVGTPMFVIKAYLPVNESFGTFVVPLIFKLLLPTNYALHAICFAGLCVSVCASETVSALSCASETVSRLRLFLRYPVRLRLFLRCLKYPLMDFHQKSVRLRLFLRYLKYPLMDFHQTFVTCASLDKDELVRFCVYGRSR